MLIYLQNELFPLTTFDIQLGAVPNTEASLSPVGGRDSPVNIVLATRWTVLSSNPCVEKIFLLLHTGPVIHIACRARGSGVPCRWQSGRSVVQNTHPHA